jgi:hypothetical protein
MIRILFLCTGNSRRSQMAEGAASDVEALDCYRQVRDEIKAFVQSLPAALDRGATGDSGGGCCFAGP